MTRAQRLSLIAIAAGAIAPFAVAAMLAAVRDDLNAATVAVVMAGVVVAVSATGRRSAAITAAVSATLWFDYFHTVPYGSFTIHERDEMVSAATLLFVGLVAASIQTRSRQRLEQVEQGSNEISRIGAVTDLVASGKPVDEIIALVELELTEVLFLRGCRYEKAPGDGRLPTIERTGEVTFGRLSWRADVQGLPSGEVELPVFAQGRFGGRFVLHPRPGVPVPFDRRIVAVALADQVGAALAMNLIF